MPAKAEAEAPKPGDTVKQIRTHRYAVAQMNPGTHRKLHELFAVMNAIYNDQIEDYRRRLRNYALYKEGKLDDKPKFPTEFDLLGLVSPMRRQYPDLAEFSVQLMRGEIKKFHRNQQRFLDVPGAGKPRFRSWRRHRSIVVDQVTSGMVRRPTNGGKWSYLNVKGLPRLKFRARRLTDDQTIKTIRVVRKARRCEVQLVVEEQVVVPEHTGPSVGVDVGVSKRMTMSDGSVVERRRRDDDRKKELQRRVSRAQKGSSNRRKKVKQMARHCERMAEREINEDHRITTSLTRQYSEIAVEDLNVQNMMANGGSRKRGLNRGIAEQSWARAVTQLTYKAESAGGRVVKVPAHYTSQDCSHCGAENANTSEVYDVFVCRCCGASDDRDVNAARNIYSRAFGGLPLMRSGPGVKTPVRRVEEDQRGGNYARTVTAQNHQLVLAALGAP